MNTPRRVTPFLLISLVLHVLALSSCVTVRDYTACSVSGILSAGGNCTHAVTPATQKLSFDEMMDFLEAQEARSCVPMSGMAVCSDDQVGTPVALPKRGAALALSSEDFGNLKMELETACRELGPSCSYNVKITIGKLQNLVGMIAEK